jgi:hypothetical protein
MALMEFRKEDIFILFSDLPFLLFGLFFLPPVYLHLLCMKQRGRPSEAEGSDRKGGIRSRSNEQYFFNAVS